MQTKSSIETTHIGGMAEPSCFLDLGLPETLSGALYLYHIFNLEFFFLQGLFKSPSVDWILRTPESFITVLRVAYYSVTTSPQPLSQL